MPGSQSITGGAIRVITILVGLVFLSSGGFKLTGAEEAVQNFARFGYAEWFMYVIGAAEVLGGIGLLVTRTTRYAALALFPLMLGAIGSHVIHDPLTAAVPAFVLLLLLELAAWWHWIRVPQLLAR